MGIPEIMASVDHEIALLRQARALLSGSGAAVPAKAIGKRGKGLVTAAAAKPAPKTAVKKRKLSPEGRKRIAEAVKRRWERQRKTAASSK